MTDKPMQSDADRAKALVQELVAQFGTDNVNDAVFACGLGELMSDSPFDSGLFDDEDDIPEDEFVDPGEEFEIEPIPDGAIQACNALETTDAANRLGLDPVLLDPKILVPLLPVADLGKDKKGNLIGTATVTKIGSRMGCRYVVVDFGARFRIKVKKKTVTVGPEITIILCTTERAKTDAEVFKNAFDLTKLREMGGTTKPGGKTAAVKVRVGWRKGNTPVRSTKDPSVWRAPDFVEKG